MHTKVLSFWYSEISQSFMSLGTNSSYQHEEGKLSISPVHLCLNWVSSSLSVASPGNSSVTSNFDLVWKWFFPRFVSLLQYFSQTSGQQGSQLWISPTSVASVAEEKDPIKKPCIWLYLKLFNSRTESKTKLCIHIHLPQAPGSQVEACNLLPMRACFMKLQWEDLAAENSSGCIFQRQQIPGCSYGKWTLKQVRKNQDHCKRL